MENHCELSTILKEKVEQEFLPRIASYLMAIFLQIALRISRFMLRKGL